jgi:hypothetical protein
MHKILFVVIVAACSGGSHATPTLDATPDGAAPATNEVAIHYVGDPLSLIAYRDGSGPWQTPDEPSAGNYVLHVTNHYQLVLVCKGTLGDGSVDVNATLYAYTLADGAQQREYCFANASSSTSAVVSGLMRQAGTVAMGTSESGATTGPWSYMLDVDPGTHDLLATADSRMVLRRDLAISTAASEPVIDVSTAEGVAMSSVPLALSGIASDDTLFTATSLVTANEPFLPISSSSTTTLTLPPASELESADQVDIYVDAASHAGDLAIDRGLLATYAGTASFVVPAPLTGITFSGAGGGTRATWSPLPELDALELSITTQNAPYLNQYVLASASWLSATGATSLSFDAMPPGFDPSWIVPAAGASSSLETQRTVGGTYSWSSASQQEMLTRGAARRRAAARCRISASARCAR